MPVRMSRRAAWNAMLKHAAERAVPSTFHPMCLIEEHERRAASDPFGQGLVPAVQAVVVHHQDFSVAGCLLDEGSDDRSFTLGKADRHLALPGVESRQWGDHQHLRDSSCGALCVVHGVGHSRLASTGHGEVRAVRQGEQAAEISDLEGAQRATDLRPAVPRQQQHRVGWNRQGTRRAASAEPSSAGSGSSDRPATRFRLRSAGTRNATTACRERSRSRGRSTC